MTVQGQITQQNKNGQLDKIKRIISMFDIKIKKKKKQFLQLGKLFIYFLLKVFTLIVRNIGAK